MRSTLKILNRENKCVHALALGGCAALLLLWHLQSHLTPARMATPAIAALRLGTGAAPSDVMSSPSDPHNLSILPTPKDKDDHQEIDRVVLIKDLYEPGHLWQHPELCGAGAEAGQGVELLVLVSSAPAHGRARRAVRLTWGHYGQRNNVVIAFVLGRAPPPLMEQVAKEDALYRDIIMGASWDTYRNLTLKTLSMLDWAGTYCPRARHLLKTDDDMFINVPRLLELLAHPTRVHNTTTIWGRIAKKWYPIRNPKSKYYLSLKQFPGTVLPEFATGPAYALSSEAAAQLRVAAPDQPFLPLEDVFFTGLLAKRLNLHLEHIPEFYNMKMPLELCVVQRGVSIHEVEYHDQFDLWRKLNDELDNCTLPIIT